jgi:spore coat polysaccharide biosynthesis protein SpsF
VNLAVLQARMSSTRLPGKVLAPVLGEPMIGRQIERLRRASRIDALVVATSLDTSDDPLAAYCEAIDVPVFRGPLHDVLERFCGVLRTYPAAEALIRLTADCPLADWSVIDRVIEHHLREDADYTNNTMPERTFPHGLDVEAVRPAAIFEAGREAVDPYEREHVTPFIYRRPERYKIASVVRSPSLGALRWTVDLPTDLAFVRDVDGELYPRDPAFDSVAIEGLARNTAEDGNG